MWARAMESRVQEQQGFPDVTSLAWPDLQASKCWAFTAKWACLSPPSWGNKPQISRNCPKFLSDPKRGVEKKQRKEGWKKFKVEGKIGQKIGHRLSYQSWTWQPSRRKVPKSRQKSYRHSPLPLLGVSQEHQSIQPSYYFAWKTLHLIILTFCCQW